MAVLEKIRVIIGPQIQGHPGICGAFIISSGCLKKQKLTKWSAVAGMLVVHGDPLSA